MSEHTIQVRINQTTHTLPQGATLADAVLAVGIQPPFAAAVNLQFVPRGQYAAHTLAKGPRLSSTQANGKRSRPMATKVRAPMPMQVSMPMGLLLSAPIDRKSTRLNSSH